MNIQDETNQLLNHCVEGFQKFRDEKIQRLKEALLSEDFIIHPKIIANNWLNLDESEFPNSANRP